MTKYIVIYTEDFKLKYMEYANKQQAYTFVEKLIADPENFVDKDRVLIVNGNLQFFDVAETRSIKLTDVKDTYQNYDPKDLG